MKNGRVGLVVSVFALAFMPVEYRITPAVIAFSAWVVVGFFPHVRVGPYGEFNQGRPRIPRAPLIIVLSLALGLWVTASADPATSWQWATIAVICVVCPFLVDLSRRHRTWNFVVGALAAVAILAAVLAAIEAATGYNPWRSVYSSSVLLREWSVTRVIVGFGHPLVVMVFAVTVGAVSVARWVKVRRGIWLFPAAAAVLLLWLSVTRSGLSALAVGIVVGLLPGVFTLRSRSRWLAMAALLVGGVAVYLVANSALFEERGASVDGTTSVDYRFRTYGPILDAIAQHWLLGVGPGAAQSSLSQTATPNIESSVLQLALGMGVPMLVLLTCLAVWLVVRSLRRGQVEAAAGLAAYLAGMASWNALDTNPALMVLLGLLILGCREGGSSTSEEPQIPKLASHVMPRRKQPRWA